MLNLFTRYSVLVVAVLATHQPAIGQSSDLKNVIETFERVLLQTEGDWKVAAEKIVTDDRKNELLQQIEALRSRTAGHEIGDAMITANTGTFVFDTPSGPVEVNFEISAQPIRIAAIESGPSNSQASVALTWENLEAELEAAAKNGFEGAVLLARDGKIVFHQAYGLANREQQIQNETDTVFAIGSAPIDFTHASILLLRDRGKLILDDKITKYFDNVPADKSNISIRHLMTGRSGLPDFHDLPADQDPDHSWIDRGEAVRRIMNQKLLFVPGEGDQHSHSAWVLLAAIVEVSSGQSYQEFTRENLYQPAGMRDTGFFGDPVDENRIAVGYGFRKSAEPNSPPNWGKTSWLVMGSGGQVATLKDLFQWEVALRAGKILSPKSTSQFIGTTNRISADGDMYGFEFLHSHNPECMFMLISNTISTREKRKAFDALGRRLYELTERELHPPTRYSVGITMAFDQQQGATIIEQVLRDGAAYESGLARGDRLISANGIAFGNPSEVFAQVAQTGDPITLIVRRDGKELKFVVTPKLRK